MAKKDMSNGLTIVSNEVATKPNATKYANNNFNELFIVDGVDLATKPNAKVAKPNANSPKLNAKTAKQKAIENVFAAGDALVKEFNEYNTNFAMRGKVVLDEILVKTYDLALKIKASADKDEIEAEMVKRINAASGEKKNVVTAKTPFMTKVVKYVVRTNRQTAHNYSRALRAAMEDNIAVVDLIGYFDGKGGIMKTTISGTQKKQNEVANRNAENRIDMMRDYIQFNAYLSGSTIDGNAPFGRLPVDKSKKPEDETISVEGTFAIFFAYYDDVEKKYLIGQGYDFGKPLEDQILRHICHRVKVGDEKFAKIVADVKEQGVAVIKQMRGVNGSTKNKSKKEQVLISA